MPLFRKNPARVAGQKAAHAWQTILAQTGEDLYALTGLDLYEHAQEEARKWLRSEYAIPPQPNRNPHISYHGGDPSQL